MIGAVIGAAASVLSAVIQIVSTFVKWLFNDIADAFKEPHRLVVRVVCGFIILGIGVHMGHRDKEDEVIKWKTAHRQLLKDAEIADAKNKDLLKSALAAKAAAEARVVAPAAVAPAGVRPVKRAASRKNDNGGSGLSGIFGVSK